MILTLSGYTAMMLGLIVNIVAADSGMPYPKPPLEAYSTKRRVLICGGALVAIVGMVVMVIGLLQSS